MDIEQHGNTKTDDNEGGSAWVGLREVRVEREGAGDRPETWENVGLG